MKLVEQITELFKEIGLDPNLVQITQPHWHDEYVLMSHVMASRTVFVNATRQHILLVVALLLKDEIHLCTEQFNKVKNKILELEDAEIEG